ncbi:MAG TPA: hypothetical protein VIL99_04465 [Ignavibacteria bacterium]
MVKSKVYAVKVNYDEKGTLEDGNIKSGDSQVTDFKQQVKEINK